MLHHRNIRRALLGATALAGAASLGWAAPAAAQARQVQFDIAPQPLSSALREYGASAEQQLIYSEADVRRFTAPALQGAYTPDEGLAMLLAGTGLMTERTPSGILRIVSAQDPQSGSAAGDGADGTVDALIVTAQKREEDIQDVPIAISAFSQEDLTRSQVAGGPDLMTQVPNFTFTKTNFTGYSIQIRGIGTQAISATVDPAVAVAFNNTPFIRNRFFEQEFYDVQRVEVLRGPQGTLYGRNATAGVVNLISAKPSYQFEAKVSADVANYNATRLEGMVNIPLVEDKVALRLAGAWTKRDGYSTNQLTGNPIDGRDLRSVRLALAVEPTDAISAHLIYEHFEEDDDRLRSGKQLCKKDPGPSEIGGIPVFQGSDPLSNGPYISQGCLPASFYSPESYQTPNGFSLPFYGPTAAVQNLVYANFDPYLSVSQSRDLRVIESMWDPIYKANTDIAQLQVNVDITPDLTLSSETAYSTDSLYSLQDYNRFNTKEGAFVPVPDPNPYYREGITDENGVFCDPQLGCSSRLLLVDTSTAKSRQFSQEFRLGSNFDGKFNFSLGGNYLRYDTEDKYYVFINSLSLFALYGKRGPYSEYEPYIRGVTDNSDCLPEGRLHGTPNGAYNLQGCIYADPNPIGSVNDQGHNYFLSKNPYKLISYAVFGEAYYNLAENLKLTAGLRWTVDKKEAPWIPSWLLADNSYGYPVGRVIRQKWTEPTGRLTLDWKPDLAFSDETLLYASYAHGYKAGGANPPPPIPIIYGWPPGVNGGDPLVQHLLTHPQTFEPEFVDAFEVGSKNTLLDGALTLNLAAFYYDYRGYQISQIVNRSAVNLNFDSEVWGAEIEAAWRPLENLRLSYKGGYQNTRMADGSSAIDLMDRTAGDPRYMVVRPFPTIPSNCIAPLDFVTLDGNINIAPSWYYLSFNGLCVDAYITKISPAGYDFSTVPNNGEGIAKDLSGNELPNAPHFTSTLSADYTIPLPSDWLVTLHTDLYYQSEAWTRVFNTEGYDKLKAYTNVNVAAIFTNEDAGWTVMAYVKNVFDRDSITGAFLNSDDTGLTTNVFLTEPRLYGLRVTKEWTGGAWWTRANPNQAGPYPLTVEFGGQVQRHDAPYATLTPDFVGSFPAALDPTALQHRDLDWGDGRGVSVTYRPAKGWSLSAGVRYGRTNSDVPTTHASEEAGSPTCAFLPDGPFGGICTSYAQLWMRAGTNWSDSSVREKEEHDVADFSIGRDFGLGFGGDDRSTLSLGLRYAQFQSTTSTAMDGLPDADLPDGWLKYPMTYHHYEADITADRQFEGVGPTLSWAAAQRLVGNDDVGSLDVEWALTGGMLFGKQKTSASGTVAERYISSIYNQLGALPSGTPMPPDIAPRNGSVTSPLVDLSVGLSYEVGRFKGAAGYRWERYFDVLDVGYDEHEDGDRTIDGPYFKLSVGFGG